MRRKSIGVCVTGYNWEYESRVVDGVRAAAEAADINVLVFAPMTHKAEENSAKGIPESVIRSESEIFRLLAWHMPDGLVLLGDSLVDPLAVGRIAAAAGEHGVPVVNVNDPKHKTQYNIELNETTAMEFAVRHLVEKHGCRKINFIGGFPGNMQTEERLSAYKKVLSEAGIPIEERRIAYGEFWNKARECTERFLEYDKPDAIVCASDTMAFFCMDLLRERGYSVPQDILVTGFDDIADCDLYTPSLTSVRRDFTGAGERAVDIIRRAWAGESVPAVTQIESKLVERCSCGCGRAEHSGFYDSRYSVVNLFKEFNDCLLAMNTRFADARTAQELYACTTNCAEFFRLKRLYICICSTVCEVRELLPEDAALGGCKGITSEMVSMVKHGHDVPCGTRFPTSQLIPEPLLEGEKPVFIGFTPLYSNDRFLGYAAYEPTYIKGQGDLFATWINSLSNNAASFYMKDELSFIAGRLSDLYIRDPLTGLYNRRGLETQGGRLIRRARDCGGVLTAVCADVDCLKQINDGFGHEGGDNAITRVALAIRESMPEDAVCARTGGDEFTVLLCSDEAGAQAAMQRVEQAIQEYNAASGLQYKVGCSCGAFSADIGKMSSDDIIRRADEEMYRVKKQRKTQRA